MSWRSASSRRRSSGSLVMTTAWWRRARRDAGLGDIHCPGKAAQRTRCSRLVQVQVLYVKESGPHESGEACLPGAVAPDLPDRAGRHVQRSAIFRREFDDSAHPPVIAFKGHRRAGVQDFSPRAFRVHASSSSSAVAGPFSGRISARSPAKSSPQVAIVIVVPPAPTTRRGSAHPPHHDRLGGPPRPEEARRTPAAARPGRTPPRAPGRCGW